MNYIMCKKIIKFKTEYIDPKIDNSVDIDLEKIFKDVV